MDEMILNATENTTETVATETADTAVATATSDGLRHRKPRTVQPKLSFDSAISGLESGALSGFTAEYGNRKAKHKVTFLSADGENMAFAAPDTGKALAKQDYGAIKTTISTVESAGFPVAVNVF